MYATWLPKTVAPVWVVGATLTGRATALFRGSFIHSVAFGIFLPHPYRRHRFKFEAIHTPPSYAPKPTPDTFVSGRHMVSMGKTRVQTRLTQDEIDRLEEYQQERDIGEADAARRLISIGLDREQQATPDGGEVIDRLDQFEQRQNEISEAQDLAQKRQTLAITLALIYIAATVATDLSGITWGIAGIVTIAIVWSTSYRVWSVSE